MGASYSNYSVIGGSPERVAEPIVQWMTAKGFEPAACPPCFDSEGDDERGLYLLSNERGTVVLFSHQHTEGDRLAFELRKLERPILKTWVYDSDIWGYDLFEEREHTAAFVSNPTYFGGPAELPLPQNGDPSRLCRVLGLPGREAMLTHIQEQRAVFHETILQRFCEALNMAVAGYDYDALRGMGAGWEGPLEIDGIRLQWLYFRESQGDWARRTTHLHQVELEESPAPPTAPPFGIPQVPECVPTAMRPAIFFTWLLMLVLRPVFWLLSVTLSGAFRLSSLPVFRRVVQQKLAGPALPFFQNLESHRRSPVRHEDGVLVNDVHRCRIRLPEGVSVEEGAGGGTVFRLRRGDRQLWWRAERPDRLAGFARLPAGAEVREDRRFFANGIPARTIHLSYRVGKQLLERWTAILQTDDALYHLSVEGHPRLPLDAAALDPVRAIVESFERLP